MLHGDFIETAKAFLKNGASVANLQRKVTDLVMLLHGSVCVDMRHQQMAHRYQRTTFNSGCRIMYWDLENSTVHLAANRVALMVYLNLTLIINIHRFMYLPYTLTTISPSSKKEKKQKNPFGQAGIGVYLGLSSAHFNYETERWLQFKEEKISPPAKTREGFL